MKQLTTLFRLIVGLLFILSGLAKTVDPIGFSFKLEEYFSESVLNIPFLEPFALPLASFFVVFEVILGLLLLLGIYKKFTLKFLLLLILFFTFLTFYSAYFNKVTDCGCFGDALKLNPWHSFYKDLALLTMILFLLFQQKHIQTLFTQKINLALLGLALSFCIYIAYQGIHYLPLKDFRAYAEGKDIKEGMKPAEELGKEPPQYQVIYTFQHGASKQIIEITDKQYMSGKWWKKPQWKMLEDLTRSVKTNKGYEAPVKDFDFTCEEGSLTDEILNEELVVVFTAYKTKKTSIEGLNKIKKLAALLDAQGIRSIGIAPIQIDFATQNCTMDGTTLKTMNRSNPGILILKKGIIHKKLSWRKLPTEIKLFKKLLYD